MMLDRRKFVASAALDESFYSNSNNRHLYSKADLFRMACELRRNGITAERDLGTALMRVLSDESSLSVYYSAASINRIKEAIEVSKLYGPPAATSWSKDGVYLVLMILICVALAISSWLFYLHLVTSGCGSTRTC